MSGVLVVYFSRTGVTETVARALAERLGADLDPVVPLEPYRGRGGFLKGVWHSLRRTTPVVAFDRNPANYAAVVVGAPIWAGRIAAPLRSWLAANRGEVRTLAAFCVSGSGQPYPAAFAEIERLARRRPVATLALAEREVRDGGFTGKLAPLARALGAG